MKNATPLGMASEYPFKIREKTLIRAGDRCADHFGTAALSDGANLFLHRFGGRGSVHDTQKITLVDLNIACDLHVIASADQ